MNTERINKDQWAMGLAECTALRASCLRRAVGCVLLNARGHVLATGYNGTPSGFDHCNGGSEVCIAEVKRSPKPIDPMPTSPHADVYYLAALAKDPDLLSRLGGVVVPKASTPSKTLTHYMSVNADHYPSACPGALSPSGSNLDGCHAIHAEQNALLQCKDVYSIESCYVTAMPCMTCTKLFLNTSCKSIFYRDEYPHAEAANLWKKSGRQMTRLFTGLLDGE